MTPLRLRSGQAATGGERVVNVAAVLWLALTIFFFSDAGTSILGIYAVLGGGVVLAAVVVLRFLFRRPCFLALVILVTALPIVFYPAPESPLFQFRFWLSRNAFDVRARALTGTTYQSLQPEWIGLFRVERITTHENGQVRFITTPCGVVDSCGVVYAPSGTPSRYMEDQFTPLHGAWWHVFEGF